MLSHKIAPKKFMIAAMTGIVASVVLTGCQTTKGAKEPEDPAAAEGAEANREEMTVQVDGANAQREGDTITLDYPVLEDRNLRIPDWVINPAIGGVVGAVGAASPKGLGVREQLDEARLSGRLELASMLETRLQSIGRSALEENLLANAEGLGEDSRRNTLGIDRDILDVVLAGSRQRALWFDPDTGECFVWMVLDGGVLAQSEHYVVDELSVFIANKAIDSIYMPERKKPQAPTVIVEAAAPVPEKEAPKEPVEVLEESLKPIEAVPIKAD